MAPSSRKRARRDAAASDTSNGVSSPTVDISGGEAFPAGLWEQRQDKLFCDAELQAGGTTTFFAHRCVLALGSPYFKALFTTQMDDACTLDMPATVFEAALHWLYQGSCSVREEELVPLLEAAIFLQVISLRDGIVAAINERLSVDSSVGAWALGARYGIPALVTAARLVCLRDFTDLSDLGALTAEQLGELLDSDELTADDEVTVFDKLTHWLAAQTTAPPEDVFAALVRKIRFETMDEAARSRIADAPEMQTLALMKIIAKSSAGTRPRRVGYIVIPRGVQHDLDDAILDGWTKHYDESYDHVTKVTDLTSVPTSAKYIFVGARNPSGAITIGASGARDAVLTATKRNMPHEDNGVYWYLTDNYSFGFAPNASIRQHKADSTLGCDRLSWHLTSTNGGYRAGGDNIGQSSMSDWRKLVYYC